MKQFIENSVVNTLGQPIGQSLPDWKPVQRPARTTLQGRTCRLVPLDVAAHARELYDANSLDRNGSDWTYSGVGPFSDFESFKAYCEACAKSEDPLFFAIIDETTGKAVGSATFMRIDPANGAIEVGTIKYSPLLQRTTAATEAMYLMMKHAFDLGYRRYEWKCDSHNGPSRRAAERLGFQFEGLFRQAVVYKGRNRDTTWFSIIDSEWPAIRSAMEAWLAPDNFTLDGQQRQGLRAMIDSARAEQIAPAG